MYKQQYTTKSKSLPMILSVVLMGFILLSVSSLLNITSFMWIYELAVIILTAAAVYHILKKSCYVYTYHILDDKVAVELSIGQKTDTLCVFKIEDIISLNNEDIKKLQEEYKTDLVYKCIGKTDISKSTQIIFKEGSASNKTSMLVFMPDTEFLQILNEKRLDIQAKI